MTAAHACMPTAFQVCKKVYPILLNEHQKKNRLLNAVLQFISYCNRIRGRFGFPEYDGNGR